MSLSDLADAANAEPREEPLTPAEIQLLALAKAEHDRLVHQAQEVYGQALRAIADSHGLPPGIQARVDLDRHVIVSDVRGPKAMG